MKIKTIYQIIIKLLERSISSTDKIGYLKLLLFVADSVCVCVAFAKANDGKLITHQVVSSSLLLIIISFTIIVKAFGVFKK
jgi:hypothetical protein